MSRCLTQSIPERDDWEEVQTSTLEEIENYCASYDIPLNFDIKPQKIKDVDKSFLKSMFNPLLYKEQSRPKEKTKKRPSKSDKNRKLKPGKLETEAEEEEFETQDDRDPKEGKEIGFWKG